MKRRIPIDAVAFAVIALVMIVGHRSALRHGMRFDDALFHFSSRAGHPYRDFAYPGAPLPIYVGALAERLLGAHYIATLYAALLVRTLRVFLVWAIARRLADVPAAAALALFCAFDPLLGPEQVSAATYVELFVLGAALCGVIAKRRSLAIGGLCAGLVGSASAGAAIVVAIVLAVGSLRWRSRLVWAGFAAGVVIVVAMLAGVLGPALDQLAGADVHVLDALTGHADGLLYTLGLPLVAVAAIVYLATRPGDVTFETIGHVAIPLGLVWALALRYGRLDLLTDVPRLFLVATAALALIAPRRMREWFGIEPVLAAVLAGLPLAADWGLALTGDGDPAALILGAILIALASSRLSVTAKRRFCGVLAIIALVGLRFAPFAIDGTISENTASSRDRWLRGMRVTEARKQTLDWLLAQHARTCLVDGNLPALYTLLDCDNPGSDPPDIVIVHEPRPSAFEVGVQGLLWHYELVGTALDNIEPGDRPLAEKSADHIGAIRVYRRRQP